LIDRLGGALSEFGELLELMHGATGRVRGVRATFVERRRPELLKRAFVRFAERVEVARGGGYFHVPLGGVASGEEADEHVWQIELAAEPGRFRQERRGPDAEHVLVVDGERWWDWSPAFGLRSHEDERGVHHHGGLDLLDPSEFLAGYALEPAGEAIIAGRPAIRVRVGCTSAENRPFGLEPGIEQAELLLDAARGVVLRRAELVDGEEAFVREVETIIFDEPQPPETFVFELPAGASARGPAEPQVTTVDAAAAVASARARAARDRRRAPLRSPRPQLHRAGAGAASWTRARGADLRDRGNPDPDQLIRVAARAVARIRGTARRRIGTTMIFCAYAC